MVDSTVILSMVSSLQFPAWFHLLVHGVAQLPFKPCMTFFSMSSVLPQKLDAAFSVKFKSLEQLLPRMTSDTVIDAKRQFWSQHQYQVTRKLHSWIGFEEL